MISVGTHRGGQEMADVIQLAQYKQDRDVERTLAKVKKNIIDEIVHTQFLGLPRKTFIQVVKTKDEEKDDE